MKMWELQNAKGHFSELVKNASEGMPQAITLKGKPVVVVLSAEHYKKLRKPKQNLVDFLRSSPLADINLAFIRDKSPGSARY